jgi:hypothetical protein
VGAAEAKEPGAAGDRLRAVIERAIKAEGPFFTAEERAVIERKCGYAPGSFDGFEGDMSEGGFRCRDGRRVDDPEMRALLAVAVPRIERRVEAAMERADIEGAVKAVAREKEAEMLRILDRARIAEEAAAQAAEEVARALERSRSAGQESRRMVGERRKAQR